MGFLRSLSLILAGITVIGTARAEDVTTVYFAGTCVPNGTSASEIFHMLEAELAPVRVLPFTDPKTLGAGEVVLGVDGCTDLPLGARVSIVHEGQRRERFVTLTDIAPDALDRTFSLALAEASRDPNYTQAVSPDRPVEWSMNPGVPAPPVVPVVPVEKASPAPKPQTPIAPRAALLFRFMPGSSTPALGVDVGLQYSRLGVGLMVLGGYGTDALGTVTLVAIAGTASYDVLDLGTSVTVRFAGELGVAIGIPDPKDTSVGHAKVAPHAALLGGIASSLPLGAGYDLQGFIGGGYGSSLNAEADGRRVASLGGGLLSIAAGIRFP